MVQESKKQAQPERNPQWLRKLQIINFQLLSVLNCVNVSLYNACVGVILGDNRSGQHRAERRKQWPEVKH